MVERMPNTPGSRTGFTQNVYEANAGVKICRNIICGLMRESQRHILVLKALLVKIAPPLTRSILADNPPYYEVVSKLISLKAKNGILLLCI
jgi:hypothetical protein